MSFQLNRKESRSDKKITLYAASMLQRHGSRVDLIIPECKTKTAKENNKDL